jgi:sorbitol-specific phosphotransferase system component IIA
MVSNSTQITVIGEWNTAGLALNDKIMISYDPNNPNNFIEVRELHKKLFLRALCKSSSRHPDPRLY